MKQENSESKFDRIINVVSSLVTVNYIVIDGIYDTRDINLSGNCINDKIDEYYSAEDKAILLKDVFVEKSDPSLKMNLQDAVIKLNNDNVSVTTSFRNEVIEKYLHLLNRNYQLSVLHSGIRISATELTGEDLNRRIIDAILPSARLDNEKLKAIYYSKVKSYMTVDQFNNIFARVDGNISLLEDSALRKIISAGQNTKTPIQLWNALREPRTLRYYSRERRHY